MRNSCICLSDFESGGEDERDGENIFFTLYANEDVDCNSTYDYCILFKYYAFSKHNYLYTI